MSSDELEELTQEELEAQTAPEPRCNCNDEYITEPCPIHGEGIFTGPPEMGGIYTMTLTDEDLVSSQASKWVGHSFICRECGREIMFNMNHCPNCGIRVKINSTTVTNILRSSYSSQE